MTILYSRKIYRTITLIYFNTLHSPCFSFMTFYLVKNFLGCYFLSWDFPLWNIEEVLIYFGTRKLLLIFVCNAIKITWESKDYRYVNISEEQETVIGPYIHESCFVVEKMQCNKRFLWGVWSIILFSRHKNAGWNLLVSVSHD